ncbi:MAG: hypothetical protein KatS3mg110_0012 [Pirellulaceae bacterium]|nr:MAG: hypothetical protein KatS3mg110_0012 [Pirellulaceae bacterium]
MTYISWNSLWNYSEHASLWYALATRLVGKTWLGVPEAHRLRLVADQLVEQLRAGRLADRPSWRKLLAEAIREALSPSESDSAARLAARLEDQQGNAGLAERVQEFAQQWRLLFPGGPHELELRSRPLRELWEARATGFWRRLLVELGFPSQRPPCWKVFWTFPVCGGYGLVLPEEASLCMEAVLVNPHAALPETVHLAWLIGQQLIWDCLDRNQVRPATVRAVGLAMLGPVLEAARYVEWLPSEGATIQDAARLWMDQPISNREVSCLESIWTGAKDHESLLGRLMELEEAAENLGNGQDRDSHG